MKLKTGLVLVLVLMIGGASLAYNGNFYLTGSQWFEGCYEYKMAKSGLFEPKTEDPYTAALWRRCKPISDRAFYSAGLVTAGSDEIGDKLRAFCPRTYASPEDIAMEELLNGGGPDFSDQFLPAERMLKALYEKQWPNCSSERQNLGLPKIIEVRPGEYVWEDPCEAEKILRSNSELDEPKKGFRIVGDDTCDQTDPK